MVEFGVSTYGADGGRSGIGSYLSEILRVWERQGKTRRLELLLDPEEVDYWRGVAPSARQRVQPRGLRRNVPGVLWHLLMLPWIAWRQGYRRLFLCASNRRSPWWCPCPMVGTVHDLAGLRMPGKYSRWHHLYLSKLLPRLIRRLRVVLTVSQASARDIEELVGIPAERVVVTPLAADLQRFSPGPPAEARQRLQADYSLPEHYVLYLARLEHPGKGHVPLIEAWDRLLDEVEVKADLVLAGSPWDGYAEIEAALAKARHRERIRLLGFVQHAHIPDLYRAADAVVFPSFYEGFGLPVLEAMGCGRALACSNRASLPEVAGSAALLFDPAQPTEIREALQQLLQNPDLKARLEVAGLQRAQCFSWEKTADQTWTALTSERE